MTTGRLHPGGYRFIPAVFQYSGDVAALPGFAIRRVRFQQPVPLAQGFERIELFMRDAGRPHLARLSARKRKSGVSETAIARTFVV
jgi:hypothetical protein